MKRECGNRSRRPLCTRRKLGSLRQGRAGRSVPAGSGQGAGGRKLDKVGEQVPGGRTHLVKDGRSWVYFKSENPGPWLMGQMDSMRGRGGFFRWGPGRRKNGGYIFREEGP